MPDLKKYILYSFIFYKIQKEASLIFNERNQDTGCLWGGRR